MAFLKQQVSEFWSQMATVWFKQTQEFTPLLQSVSFQVNHTAMGNFPLGY